MLFERDKIVRYLYQPEILPLYKTSGKTIFIKDFIRQHISCLDPHEVSIILRNMHLLEINKIPNFLVTPLTINNDIAIGKSIKLAKRLGSRSAYLVKEKIKLKGCRPIPGIYFPHNVFEFGGDEIINVKIPFGSLSAENVMREILAFCFFKEHQLPLLQIPICVFQYDLSHIQAYSLVLLSPYETRIENQENDYNLKIRDVILISEMEKFFDVKVLPKEIKFKGVNNVSYARQKGKLLATMNINGGFRGILNSNLGNDIYYKSKIYICDFDTFRVINVPSKPTSDFITKFILWCLVEILKTSPLVLGYFNIDRLSRNNATAILWYHYSNNSLLWKYYWKYLCQYAENKGWNLKLLNESLKICLKSRVIYDLILDNVLNSKILKNTYPPSLSLYKTHN